MTAEVRLGFIKPMLNIRVALSHKSVPKLYVYSVAIHNFSYVGHVSTVAIFLHNNVHKMLN